MARTVDELADRLLVRVAIGHKGLNNLQHFHRGLGELDENTIIDLEQTQKLQSFALLGINLVDALDPDDKSKLGLFGNVDALALLGLARQPHPLPVGIAVFLDILLGPCEDDLALLLVLVCLMSALPTTSIACNGTPRGRCSHSRKMVNDSTTLTEV